MSLPRNLLGIALGTSLASGAPSAFSAGFALFEQSVSGLGNAFAGGAASAEDATTVYFNPAGMSRLDSTQLVVGAHIVAPSTQFRNEGSSTNALLGGAPLAGDSGDDAGEAGVVPNLYLTTSLTDRLNVGLGINAPFGLKTDYDEGWVGRYHALTSDLATVNINPAISFKVNDKLSLGFGANAMYADLKEYSNALDSFGVCVGATGRPAACRAAGLPGPANAATDSRVTLEGDAWGYGFNVGLVYQTDSRTRIGIAYRSSVDLTLEGETDYEDAPTGLQALLAGTPLLQDTDFEADVSLPESLSISSYQVLNPKWTMMGDITWTRWNRFDELVANFDNGAPDLVQPQDWGNTYRVSLGMTYTHNPRWKWRFGVAYDDAAVKDQANRSPRIPDQDRVWVSTGFSYSPMDNVILDAAYAHLFVDDGKTRFKDPTTDHELVGAFESDIDILSAQLRWLF